jgi:integrase/recombinase XerD
MLSQVFHRAAVRARISSNPIGRVLRRYVGYLATRGHHAGVLHQYVFAAEHFGRWLGQRPLNRDAVNHFIRRHLPQCDCDKPTARNIACVRASLNRLLEMLGRDQHRCAGTEPADQLLQRYKSHLEGVCGLSPATVRYRLRYARAFMRRRGLRHISQLGQWSPPEIARYVEIAGRQHKPSSGQVMAGSIRSFLRFLLLQGLIGRDLAAAVPSFATWRLASLPTTVGPEDLENLVRKTDARTAIGKRDRAVLLCMTQLGMRAADVAALQVEGVDLPAGILRLHRPKQRDQVELPMPRRLADAIRAYLCHGRPTCTAATLFVIHRAPVGQGLKSIGIRGIVIRRATAAGLQQRVRGTHVIRHSVATTLINRGATLKQIADLLGHRSIDTTSIYAKVDLHSLSRVALPWPTLKEVVP